MASGHMIKSFQCSFCERGFSNAQALGGHMNIHRRDRAKLKEFSDENLLSLDITKTVEFPKQFSSGNPNEEAKKAADSTDKIQDFVPTDEHHDSVRSLQLFEASDDENNSEKSKELIHGGLDLELRLGFEPLHDAKIN